MTVDDLKREVCRVLQARSEKMDEQVVHFDQLTQLRAELLALPLPPNTRLALERSKTRSTILESLARVAVALDSIEAPTAPRRSPYDRALEALRAAEQYALCLDYHMAADFCERAARLFGEAANDYRGRELLLRLQERDEARQREEHVTTDKLTIDEPINAPLNDPRR